jgi:hypothetical protein
LEIDCKGEALDNVVMSTKVVKKLYFTTKNLEFEILELGLVTAERSDVEPMFQGTP